MSQFKIDFFEVMFLAEACIPPAPIARSMFWEDFCGKHYEGMTPAERVRAFEWLNRLDRLDPSNEAHQLFLCRYNPTNQYRVTATDGSVHDCFLMNGRYYVKKNRWVNDECVQSAEPIAPPGQSSIS